jgi:anti-sigma B factor antagonist
MDAPLSTRLEHGPDGVRIGLHGRIDREGDAVIQEAYARATAEAAAAPVILDFAGVDYINSTGIALIVRLLAEARRDRREVRARGLTDHYREIFRITRLADFMVLEQDLAAPTAGTEGATR